MKITIETIPHSLQRYDTCGDWQISPEGNWKITVSAIYNWRGEVLIAIHELIEMLLCRDVGVTQHDVDNFDMNYKGDGEPGESRAAPYYTQHGIASGVERLLAGVMNINWKDFEEAIDELSKER